MTLPTPSSSDRIQSIYLALTQYPILAGRIRAKMRGELFVRGIILPDVFEEEVREKAILSQEREGLKDPFSQESYELWQLRLERIRDALTDFYFAYNLPYEEFETIVRQTLGERGEPPNLITFNPELAPQDMLFEQAEMIERLPAERRKGTEARLEEIKAVLIRTMISDQLAYLSIARKWFTIEDLRQIRRQKIGYGKIGGKSAGMMLAYRILQNVAPPEVRRALRIPVSYFLASDVFYTFLSANGLVHWSDQKYKPDSQIRDEYPQILQEFTRGQLPRDILERLIEVLREAGSAPLIVRSSSLLEDNIGTSFAGKYDSFFCPNQGTPEENLKALVYAITRIYASVFNPNALLYRQHKGLTEYDERIAILIQHVQGQKRGRYFYPDGAGVAFSRNLYRWSPQIRREDGFLRLVWGLGTRAVDTVGDDHPRLVALSHPLLHPAAASRLIRRYSQKAADVVDLETNTFTTVPLQTLFNPRDPHLRYAAQVDEGDYLIPIRSSAVDAQNLVVTFDELLRRTPFAAFMRQALRLLEENYHSPVDTEFTVEITEPLSVQPGVSITLLQCRPQSAITEEDSVRLPDSLPEEKVIFATRRMVPRGAVPGIEYVLFVSPKAYFSIPSEAQRTRLERAIGQVNRLLQGHTFICVGPGRWGTSTPDLGVHIAYGDIYNTRALVELSGASIGTSPEPSFGTHFFQDLMEANIFPLAVSLDDADAFFRWEFFEQSPNRLREILPEADEALENCLRLIAVSDFRPGSRLSLVMDDEQGRAAAYLDEAPSASS